MISNVTVGRYRTWGERRPAKTRRAMAGLVLRRIRRTGGQGRVWELALGEQGFRRFRSSGGRPTAPEWEMRRLVPFRQAVWERMREAGAGVGLSPGQVAAMLVEDGARRLGTLGDREDVGAGWLREALELPPMPRGLVSAIRPPPDRARVATARVAGARLAARQSVAPGEPDTRAQPVAKRGARAQPVAEGGARAQPVAEARAQGALSGAQHGEALGKPSAGPGGGTLGDARRRRGVRCGCARSGVWGRRGVQCGCARRGVRARRCVRCGCARSGVPGRRCVRFGCARRGVRGRRGARRGGWPRAAGAGREWG